MKFFLLFIFYFLVFSATAQYAPQAGLPGSGAISATSSVFVGWAAGCTVYRGFMDIANPSLGYASAGDSSLGTGPANGYTVSLGDSGVAVLTFAHAIYNGTGPDFAVFENGFLDPSNDSGAFLELGFVEVSSDGINYTRFPATSLTQDQLQLNNDSYIYANNLNNLAGSYITMYGTPFDLQELAGTPGLDINNVTHVRIVDVVGSISGHSSFDAAHRIINDPYPTAYPTCGFDLDAVGVINQVADNGVKQLVDNISVSVFPNPTTDNVYVSVKGQLPEGLSGTFTSVTGVILQQCSFLNSMNILSVEQYPAGMYFLILCDANGDKWVEKITKR